MVWNHDKKIIFVHIPKTGGSTIELAMGTDKNDIGCGFGEWKGIALQHGTVHDIKTFLGNDIFDEYEKISIYRNPYSRMISEYYWCQIKDKGYKGKQTFDSFLDYVDECVRNENFNETIYHDHFIPQHKFVFDDNDKLVVDKIFNFDNFNTISEYLLEKYDINTNSIHDKKNTIKNKIVLNESQKRKIYDMYKKDFELFNIDPELKDFQNLIDQCKSLEEKVDVLIKCLHDNGLI